MHGPVKNNPVRQNFEIKIFDDQCLSQTYHITVFTKQKKFEDTKGVISSCKSTQDRQYNGQQKKDRQYNGQQKKDRQYNGQQKKGETTIYNILYIKLN